MQIFDFGNKFESLVLYYQNGSAHHYRFILPLNKNCCTDITTFTTLVLRAEDVCSGPRFQVMCMVIACKLILYVCIYVDCTSCSAAPQVPISKGAQGVTGLETKKLVSDDCMEAAAAASEEDGDEDEDDEDLSDLEEGRDSHDHERGWTAISSIFKFHLQAEDFRC